MSAWRIYRGTTFRRSYTWRNAETNAPILLAGVFSIELRLSSGQLLLRLATNVAANVNGTQMLITDAALGKFEFVIKNADTLLLPATSRKLAVAAVLQHTDLLGETKRLYGWNCEVRNP